MKKLNGMISTLTAKELRVGNWFQYSDHEKVKPERRGKAFQTIADDIVFLEENPDFEFIHAIELTKEWLMNFGARQQTSNCIWIPITELKSELHFEIYDHEIVTTLKGQFCDLILNQIKFVHQLQNLYFVLTGSEMVHK